MTSLNFTYMGDIPIFTNQLLTHIFLHCCNTRLVITDCHLPWIVLIKLINDRHRSCLLKLKVVSPWFKKPRSALSRSSLCAEQGNVSAADRIGIAEFGRSFMFYACRLADGDKHLCRLYNSIQNLMMNILDNSTVYLKIWNPRNSTSLTPIK